MAKKTHRKKKLCEINCKTYRYTIEHPIKIHFRTYTLSILCRAQSVIDANGFFMEDFSLMTLAQCNENVLGPMKSSCALGK